MHYFEALLRTTKEDSSQKGHYSEKRPTHFLRLPNRRPRSYKIPALAETRCLSRCGEELNL